MNEVISTSETGTAPDAGTPASYVALVWRQFRRRRAAMAGLGLTVLFFLVAFLAPFLCHRLPLVWWPAGAEAARYPLLREFFAPANATEPFLEKTFNFLLLFLPLAALLLRLLPAWKERAGRWVALLLGVAAAAGLAGFVGSLLLSFHPDAVWARVALWVLFLLVAGGFGAGILLAASQAAASPRWLLVLALGGVLLLPFLLIQPRNDPTDYRALAEEGAGGGIFPLLPYGPNEQGFGPMLAPSWHGGGRMKAGYHKAGYHVFGTDEVGRDALARMIHGARVSLSVGFVSVAILTLIGVAVGACAGYFGGWVDIAVSRVVEVMMCLPTFFLILTIIALLDRRSILNIMLVIGLTGWTGIARLVRGEVLKQRALDYVASARALGAPSSRIIFRHILPNAIAPVLVAVSFGIAGAILTEAGLSFLGFGVAPPTPTWGEMLNQAREAPLTSWWLAIFPGVFIFLAMFAYNLVGEGLRDALDPRLRRSA